jgi:hypothetical protein
VVSKKTSLGCGGIAFLFIVGAIVGPFVPDSKSTDPPNYGGGAISETPAPTPEPTATEEVPDVPAKSGSAMKALNRLKVKAMTSGAGYDRERKFGDAWIDVDANGCDTRNDILARDFASITRTDGCIIYSGVIRDKYTGDRIRFTRGQTTSLAVQVDHVVALHNAWMTGANKLSYEMRVALANDPLNLQAVDGPTNSRKSDSDASWWLPPRFSGGGGDVFDVSDGRACGHSERRRGECGHAYAVSSIRATRAVAFGCGLARLRVVVAHVTARDAQCGFDR